MIGWKMYCRLIADIRLFNICVTNDDKELIALGWDDDYHLYYFDQSTSYVGLVVKNIFSIEKILFVTVHAKKEHRYFTYEGGK